ncbi:hypothetical protein AJ79_06574 [Helicocarpus griseus UAMH5409]|uniref:Nephrocystin 3-like N-terminal domain-containing protein n=1 Tax=Helicocarpus griseus UAMH5409 TaxID=1447875 RepID=A0A2B7XC39_9EURO|nr:hypothetical protein AJ79_06574 [Helicocarpus griseus UAMH5409]
MLSRLAHVTGYIPPESLASWLQNSPQILMDFSRRYNSIAGMFKTLTLYEQEQQDSDRRAVVKKEFAVLGTSFEKLHPLWRPHVGMCRIPSSDDIVFHQICESIMTASKPDPIYWECLRTFSRLSCEGFASNNPCLDAGASSWITQTEAFQVWMTSNEGCILHLVGESGTGLSATSDYLATKCRVAINIVIHFAFDRRNPSCCSTPKMFASLIGQLLSADPACFRRAGHLYDLLKRRWGWSLGSLWTFFRSLLLVPRSVPTVCIIGGYNKCDDTTSGYFLSDVLLSLAGSTVTTVKIIINDPGSAFLAVPSRLMIDLSMEQKPHKQAVEFATSQLFNMSSRDSAFQLFEDHLRQAMSGPSITFLTARLILNWLEELGERTTKTSLSAALRDIPSSVLVALRICFVPRLRSSGSSWGEHALSWVVHAFRPLSIDELAVALAVSGQDDRYVVNESEVPQNLSKDLSMSLEILRLFKMARSDDEMTGHTRIAHICIDYILSNEVPEFLIMYILSDNPDVSSGYPPLLRYACQF